jgi:hypothetical protein
VSLHSTSGHLVLGVTAGVTAFAYFAHQPPMHALVGTTPIEALVPAEYQASVFPAFATFIMASAIDYRNAREQAYRRTALLLVTAGIAVVRLCGALPVSGHAVFLAAAASFELCTAPSAGRGARLLLMTAGAGVTAFYKLAVWHDGLWLAVSTVIGVALGFCMRRAGSASPGQYPSKPSTPS